MADIFTRNPLWSVALYAEDDQFSFEKKLKSPIKIFDSKKLRKSRHHLHTHADPFLFSYAGELFLFLETQAVGGIGKIEAFKTSDLEEFTALGEVIKENHHLSYPFVFKNGASILMIPETLYDHCISLYKFENFPFEAVKVRTLLDGEYWDSSVIRHDGTDYLFTSSERGLEVFYTDDIESGMLTPHPQNPLSTDPRYCRCGGSPVIIGGEIYRIAQDFSSEYGKNIHILKIKKLSETEYEEEVFIENYFDNTETWNRRGGHHFSIADFKGRKVIAVDGKQNDYLINKFLSVIFSKL